MPFHVYLVEPPALLDDLLEESERIYHHHCAIIQRIFHEEWRKRVAEEVGREQIEHPDDKPVLVEARACQRLRGTRLALKEKQDELIREEEQGRALRDRAIRAWVASLPASTSQTAAA